MDLSGIALAVIAAGILVFLFKGRKKPVEPFIPNPSPPPTPVSNLTPEVFPPFLAGEIDFGGQFIIDLRHRIHGCDAGGAPTDETGAYDPSLSESELPGRTETGRRFPTQFSLVKVS